MNYKTKKSGYLIYSGLFFLMFFLTILLMQTCYFKYQISAYHRRAEYYKVRAMKEVAYKIERDSMTFNKGKVVHDKINHKYVVILNNGRKYKLGE